MINKTYNSLRPRLNDRSNVTSMDRLYGKDKKDKINKFLNDFVDEIETLFKSKFDQIAEMNIGEGETTRIVGRMLNAKINVIDQIKGEPQ